MFVNERLGPKSIMNVQVGRTSAVQIGARSLLAFALEPKPPMVDWLAAVDEWLVRSPKFFAGKPVILQMSGVEIALKEYRDLLGQLARRHIRVMAVENAHKLLVGPHLPPVVAGGRVVSADKLFEEPAASAVPAPEAPPEPPPAASAPPPRPETLYHDGNLRSGQQIVHLDGDVIVLGRVASGAEIVAGGAVHIYGALQGRVFAGVAGASDARIFCREARAEFLCIGEAFVTAEDMDPKLEGLAIEARLDGGRLTIRILN
jgi:septum site-determining protein MinC